MMFYGQIKDSITFTFLIAYLLIHINSWILVIQTDVFILLLFDVQTSRMNKLFYS